MILECSYVLFRLLHPKYRAQFVLAMHILNMLLEQYSRHKIVVQLAHQLSDLEKINVYLDPNN